MIRQACGCVCAQHHVGWAPGSSLSSACLASSSVQPFPSHTVTVGLFITDGKRETSSLACLLCQNMALSRATQRNSQNLKITILQVILWHLERSWRCINSICTWFQMSLSPCEKTSNPIVAFLSFSLFPQPLETTPIGVGFCGLACSGYSE